MNAMTSHEIKSLALEIYRLWKADRRKGGEKDVEYLSSRGAAKMLGCSVDTIRRHVRHGDLPSVKAGNRLRIPKAAVLAYLK